MINPEDAKLPAIDYLARHIEEMRELMDEELDRRQLHYLDFITGKGKHQSNRLDQAEELALSGRWEYSLGYRRPFFIDSHPGEPGNRRYEVEIEGHPGHSRNSCSCDGFHYQGKKLGYFCKHVLAAWMVRKAHLLLVEELATRAAEQVGAAEVA